MRWFLLFLVVSFSWLVNGQQTTFDWVKPLESFSSVSSYDIALDGDKNIIAVGTFFDTADFDPSSATYNLTSNGDGDIFVSKLDSSGNFQWAISIGAGYSDAAYAVKTDTLGNIYVTGQFTREVDFDPGPDSLKLSSFLLSFHDAFVMKLNPAGHLMWAKSFGGNREDAGIGLWVKKNGEIIVSGTFANAAVFGPPANTNYFFSNGLEDAFVMKLSNAGNLVWVKNVGGVSDDGCYELALDPNENIYMAGSYSHNADFDPDTSKSHNLSSTRWHQNGYVLKLDPNGNFEWVKDLNSADEVIANSLAVAPGGKIWVSGAFEGILNMGTLPNGSSAQLVNSSSGGFFDFDVFLARLDSTGNTLMASKLGGPSPLEAAGPMATDDCGNLYFAPRLDYMADINPDPNITETVSETNGLVFLKIDSTGQKRWHRIFESPTSGYSYVNYFSFGLEGTAIYSTGTFSGTLDFDFDSTASSLLTSLDTTFNSWGSGNAFLHKFSQCVTHLDSQFVACNQLLINGDTLTKSGRYSIKDFENDGCDTIVNLDLTVHPLDTTVFKLGKPLTANQNSAKSYQWVDCFQNYKILPGDTQQVFSAAYNGNFAVIIDNGFCADTSQCVTVASVSTEEFLENHFQLFPNPTTGKVQISFPENFSEIQLTLFDFAGNRLARHILENSQTMDLKGLANGIYFLEISHQNQIFHRRLVKQ